MTTNPPKLYLLVYASTLGTREEVKNCLDSIPEILRWRTDLPSSFYLSSTKTADELVDLIIKRRGKQGRFVISEITLNTQGWLQPDTWAFLGRTLRKQS